MPLTKSSKRPLNWLLSFVVGIFSCSFIFWGARELLFPPTDVCAIERTKGRDLTDISQVYPIENNLELIGHVGGKAQSAIVRGDIAFVKLGLELAAFDVRDPAVPKRIGYILIPGELIHVDINGYFAYIYSSDDRLGLWKVDISNPAQMSAVHVYKPIDHVTSIRIFDDLAYITTRKCEYIYFLEGGITTRCDNTIHIVDTVDLDSPIDCYQGLLNSAVKTFAVSGVPELITAPKIAHQGNYTYAAEEKGGLKIYDVSNPIQMVEVGSYASISKFTGVVTYQAQALATSLECKDQETHYCLYAFDVTTPADPKGLGELPYKPVIVTTFNHYAIVREQFGYDNWPSGVEILDMSLPKSEGTILAPIQIAEIVNMVVVDNRAYATTRDNRFLMLDMSKIENPIVIASHSLGRHDQLNNGVSVVSNYAYIIVRDIGMRILDISNESNIIEAGVYEMKTIPVELTVKDHYAYIAEWYGNLEIVDVSDPMRPIRVSVYDAVDRINKMHIVNNFLFMTTGSSGLQVIDISDPTSPYLVGSFITGTFVAGIDVACPYIYISDIDNGLFVLRSDLVPVDTCD